MTPLIENTFRSVYIVDGTRTPFLKAQGKPGPFTASDLALQASRDLLARQPFDARELDEVILGCTIPSPDEANIARILALRLGCSEDIPAYTVQRNCASGMQALDSAYKDIRTGRHDLVLTGGTEAMSHAPLLFQAKMVLWLSRWYGAKTTMAKLKLLPQLRPQYFAPVIALLRGLRDPIIGESMGGTAENLAYDFHITRKSMDEFALQSHQRVGVGQATHLNEEIASLFDTQGNFYQADDGVRHDSSMEKLAKLKPYFDKIYGMVTPGNSSQVSDGAATLLLASEAAVKRYELPVMAKIVDCHWAGVSPSSMGLGPVHATIPMLQRQGLGMDDIDYWEINEAFAAQVIACIRAFAQDDYCQQHFGGLAEAFGTLDPEKLNVDGGAIALGHPVGASGARIVLHLAHVLKQRGGKRGVASICIGGGQGGAMLIERVNSI